MTDQISPQLLDEINQKRSKRKVPELTVAEARRAQETHAKVGGDNDLAMWLIMWAGPSGGGGE